jgi:hypothetical protein
MMTKLKGAAILGAMAFAGVMLVSSFPASSATGSLLVSARRLQNACKNTGSTETLCKLVATLVDRWGPTVEQGGPIPADLARKVLLRKLRTPVKRAFKSGCCEFPCDPGAGCPGVCNNPCGADRCENCIQLVSDIEAYLSTNATAASLADTLSGACLGRFADQATTDECIGQIKGLVPELIDIFVANFPPVTACQNPALRYCPQP